MQCSLAQWLCYWNLLFCLSSTSPCGTSSLNCTSIFNIRAPHPIHRHTRMRTRTLTRTLVDWFLRTRTQNVRTRTPKLYASAHLRTRQLRKRRIFNHRNRISVANFQDKMLTTTRRKSVPTNKAAAASNTSTRCVQLRDFSSCRACKTVGL